MATITQMLTSLSCVYKGLYIDNNESMTTLQPIDSVNIINIPFIVSAYKVIYQVVFVTIHWIN